MDVVETLGCACGATLELHARFCTACGASAPPLPDLTVAGPATFSPRIEASLRRLLRDVDDGHLGIWGRPGDPKVDRVVTGHASRIPWVRALLERGWIAPDRRSGQRRMCITDVGRRALVDEFRPIDPGK